MMAARLLVCMLIPLAMGAPDMHPCITSLTGLDVALARAHLLQKANSFGAHHS